MKKKARALAKDEDSVVVEQNVNTLAEAQHTIAINSMSEETAVKFLHLLGKGLWQRIESLIDNEKAHWHGRDFEAVARVCVSSFR